MTILFTMKIADKHQMKLQENFPKQSFVFSNNMDEAKHHLEQADVLVTYSGSLTNELIESATKLKWIMVMAAGVDKLPTKPIQNKKILVTNASGIHKKPMAEYAISMLLQVYRQEKAIMKNEEKHKWEQVYVREITGKTILIAGTGAIGQEVARIAKAFQMKTYGVSRSGRTVEYFDKNITNNEMATLLPEADFVVSVLPSTPETKHFFTYEHFQQLPDRAVFLNMGRGDAVCNEDLLKAVQQEEIAHAVLDVFDEEPLPEKHPFWKEENITVTPHLSGLSPHYMSRALEIFEQNLHTYIENRNDFVNQVDLIRGY